MYPTEGFRVSSIRLRLAAALLPATLVLAGCGDAADTPEGAPPTTGTAVAGESAELEPVQVEGEAGAKPTIGLPEQPFTVSGPGFRVIEPGDGEELTEDHSVSANFLLVNGRDGSELQSSFGNQVVALSLRDETLQPAIRSALVGQQVGARVLVAVPAREAVGEEGNPDLGVEPADTLLYYFEVSNAKTPLTEATGEAVPPQEGLPTVEMGETPNDPATISVPDEDPPGETVVQPLIQGAGPAVQAGQTVRVSYTGVTWRDPANPFDYSGATPQGYAEFPVGRGGLIQAWEENIPGQNVGSRILMIVPPEEGYGQEGREPEIQGDDTLVFVIDILDAS